MHDSIVGSINTANVFMGHTQNIGSKNISISSKPCILRTWSFSQNTS